MCIRDRAADNMADSVNTVAGPRRRLAITYLPDDPPTPRLREPPPPLPWSNGLPKGSRYVICKDCLYFRHDVSYYRCITCHGEARGRMYTTYVACDSEPESNGEDQLSKSDDLTRIITKLCDD